MTKIINYILNFPKYLGLFLIKIYQKLFSFDHSFWASKTTMRVCIYHPSCSQYTYEAISRFGLVKGSIMGFFRILRCNGFNSPGQDPVPERFSIKRNKLD